MSGLMLCAGTIKTAEQAEKFIEAGAQALISPFFDNSISDTAYMEKILWIPGCMTPTEIQQAVKAGCTMIKLFPGSTLQPSFLQAIRPVFPGLDFMVTGGVDPSKENMAGWFQAGASALGLGSHLISAEILRRKDYSLLALACREALARVAQIRTTLPKNS